MSLTKEKIIKDLYCKYLDEIANLKEDVEILVRELVELEMLIYFAASDNERKVRYEQRRAEMENELYHVREELDFFLKVERGLADMETDGYNLSDTGNGNIQKYLRILNSTG